MFLDAPPADSEGGGVKLDGQSLYLEAVLAEQLTVIRVIDTDIIMFANSKNVWEAKHAFEGEMKTKLQQFMWVYAKCRAENFGTGITYSCDGYLFQSESETGGTLVTVIDYEGFPTVCYDTATPSSIKAERLATTTLQRR